MAWDDLHEQKNPDDRKGGGGSMGKPPFDIPQLKIPKFKPSMVLGIIVFLLVIRMLLSSTYQIWVYFVEPDEEGVVTTFGKFSRTTGPGLHFKFPSPVEHAATPKVKQVRRAEIGFRTSASGQLQRVPAESLMLTGDQNIVDINLVVQYRIKDSVAFFV